MLPASDSYSACFWLAGSAVALMKGLFWGYMVSLRKSEALHKEFLTIAHVNLVHPALGVAVAAVGSNLSYELGIV